MISAFSNMWRLQGRGAAHLAQPAASCSLSRNLPSSSPAVTVLYHNNKTSPFNNLLQRIVTQSASAANRQSNSSSSAAAAAAAEPEPAAAFSRPKIAQLLGVRLPSYCSGCGVKLQQIDPDGPGYFQVPKRLLEIAEEQVQSSNQQATSQSSSGKEKQQQQPLDAQEREQRNMDAALEAWLDEQQKPAIPNLGGPSQAASSSSSSVKQANVKCARCFSLVHYGKVKSIAAEGALPAFDLEKKVGRKIALQKDRKATVLCVVDVADFDGSLPRAALSALAGMGPDGALPKNPDDLPFDLTVAVNKFDLLPTQATAQRVQQWVRSRMQQAGLPRPSRVFMVSALNGLGVQDMLSTLRGDMGFRADLWVVGAQNAGKSSLIAAMRRLGKSSASSADSSSDAKGADGDPTIAPIPGTTLGLLQVAGVPLGPKHRVFDTPGVPHSYQLTAQLTPDELAAVLPRRRLKPRTYCIPVGNSILIGGFARLDVVSGPSTNMYVTVFVSDEIVTHMGKTAGAEERLQKHAGGLLVPPYDAARLQQLQLVPRTATVQGDSWKQSCKDIAISGLGWIAVGVSGTAELKLWVPQGVTVTLHDALIPDFAKVWQKPGFSRLLPQASKAGKTAAAAAAAKKRRQQQEEEDDSSL